MANEDHLILAIGVGAIVTTILYGALVQPQPPPVPKIPYIHISFFAEEEEYAIGDSATFVLVNRGPLTFALGGFGISRLVEDEWVPVTCPWHSVPLTLGPYDWFSFSTTIHAPYEDCSAELEEAFGPLPPFGPGRFAGRVQVSIFERDVDSAQFLAEFDVV